MKVSTSFAQETFLTNSVFSKNVCPLEGRESILEDTVQQQPKNITRDLKKIFIVEDCERESHSDAHHKNRIGTTFLLPKILSMADSTNVNQDCFSNIHQLLTTWSNSPIPLWALKGK